MQNSEDTVFDFTTVDVTESGDQGTWMPVKHPGTNREIPGARILVASYDSEVAAEQKRKVQKRRLRRGADVTPEELESEGLEMLYTIVRDWEGIIWKGEAVKCDRPGKVLMLNQPWLRRQIDQWAQSASNYLPNS